VIAAFTSLMAARQAAAAQHARCTTNVRVYMRYHAVPLPLQDRVLGYLSYLWRSQ
jgi:hypothetical protein